MSQVATDPRIRFASKIRFEEECWIWTGNVLPNGYGILPIKGESRWRSEYAHRFSYEGFVGPIPDGLDIDHLCRVRNCVNPDHLEPVTRQENLRRGISANREKTHCPEGHEYTPENTYRQRGGGGYWGRKCLTCIRARDKERARQARILRELEGPKPPRRKTHCKHGHELTAENTTSRNDNNGRRCLTCDRERSRRRKRNRKAAA